MTALDNDVDDTYYRCVARPSTGLVHVNAPCQCFAGGPAPIRRDAQLGQWAYDYDKAYRERFNVEKIRQEGSGFRQ